MTILLYFSTPVAGGWGWGGVEGFFELIHSLSVKGECSINLISHALDLVYNSPLGWNIPHRKNRPNVAWMIELYPFQTLLQEIRQTNKPKIPIPEKTKLDKWLDPFPWGIVLSFSEFYRAFKFCKKCSQH